MAKAVLSSIPGTLQGKVLPPRGAVQERNSGFMICRINPAVYEELARIRFRAAPADHSGDTFFIPFVKSI